MLDWRQVQCDYFTRRASFVKQMNHERRHYSLVHFERHIEFRLSYIRYSIICLFESVYAILDNFANIFK